MLKANELLNAAKSAGPAINSQFPAPRVIEATDDVINLDVPFTLQLPAINSDSKFDVLLVFINADSTFSPQAIVHLPAVKGVPTEGKVDNSTLLPPFHRDQNAVLQCFLRIRETDIWQRTPDSVIYRF